MEAQPRFSKEFQGNKVCRLKRALYGLSRPRVHVWKIHNNHETNWVQSK